MVEGIGCLHKQMRFMHASGKCSVEKLVFKGELVQDQPDIPTVVDVAIPEIITADSYENSS